MTINDSWGYRIEDLNYKSTSVVLRMLADCISMGGNLLLDIGPRADGTIPEQEVAMLKSIGRWVSKHQEAVYETKAGIPSGHIQGYTSLSKDGCTIYVYLPYQPIGSVELKGLKSKVKNVRIVGTDFSIAWQQYNDISWSEVPGVYYFDIPEDALDAEMTVMAIELDEPVKLYCGPGQVISFNDNELK